MELTCLNCTTQKINQFKSKGIETVEDLVSFLPRKYYDFRNPKLVKDTVNDELCAIIIHVTKVELKTSNAGKKFVSIRGYDEKRDMLYITFFNQPYIANQIYENRKYIFAGKMSISNGFHTFVNPMLHSDNIVLAKKMYPVYSSIKRMSDDYLKQKISQALQILNIEDYLEPDLLSKYNLINANKAKVQIHSPRNPEEIEDAKKRYLFDDLFLFNFLLEKNNQKLDNNSSHRISKLSFTNDYINNLPFKLTEGQSSSIKQMINKTRENKRINALVQGDVGAGKTEVCKAMMLCAFENGWQSVVMAPTQILAQQHYNDISKSFAKYGINIAFLHSKIKVREKKKILKGIEDGSINMIVGTHSVISDDVHYKNLGLFVVDEEHRFGVAQREKLEEKASKDVHCIRMSATPIPRTLAISLYGDQIDVLTIKTLPAGRKPVITKEIENIEDAYDVIISEVNKGHQAYIVCPLIDDSDSDKLSDVESLETTYKEALNILPKSFKIGLINGKMKEEEVQSEIQKFLNKEYDVIISTTIIEVGVNVPNATVILVKSAERFGLAQMHQLRGRVGRSTHQSYCLLSAKVKTDEGRQKIDAMIKTTDGFKIAEEDLRIRGTGDFIGTSQSGFNKYVMLMLANSDLNDKIKADIKEIYSDKNRLQRYTSLLNVERYQYS